jgi:hypothetical protein
MLRTGDRRLFLGVPISTAFRAGKLERGPATFPPPPVSGFGAWFDASDVSSLTRSGGAVTQWNDKSGNGLHATASGQNSPFLARDPLLFGGRTALAFHQSILASSAAMDDRTFTAFVIAVCASVSSNGTLIGGINVGSNQFRVDQTTGRLTTNDAGTSLIATQSNASVTVGTPFLAVQVLSATDCTQILNGVSETDTNSDTFTGGRTLWIGNQALAAGGREPFFGLIGEVVIYYSTLDSGDVTLVSNHLRAKWSV